MRFVILSFFVFYGLWGCAHRPNSDLTSQPNMEGRTPSSDAESVELEAGNSVVVCKGSLRYINSLLLSEEIEFVYYKGSQKAMEPSIGIIRKPFKITNLSIRTDSVEHLSDYCVLIQKL